MRTENGVEYGDLPKFVNYDYVANVARLNAATLASLAAAPAPPANVRILTKELQNDSTLVWDASPGGLATGYEVLWRDTAASDWQHAKDVGNATKATLPMSKDNVFFAVRAVDAKGHRSLGGGAVAGAVTESPRVCLDMRRTSMPWGLSMGLSFPPFTRAVKQLLIANCVIFLLFALFQAIDSTAQIAVLALQPPRP